MSITLGLFKKDAKEPIDTVCFSHEKDVKRWTEYLFDVNMASTSTHVVYRKIAVDKQ